MRIEEMSVRLGMGRSAFRGSRALGPARRRGSKGRDRRVAQARNDRQARRLHAAARL